MPLFNDKISANVILTSQPLIGDREDDCKSKSISIAIPIASEDVKIENVKKSLAERIPAFGLLCALLSVICFSLAAVIVKLLTDLHSIEILVIRSVFQLLFYGSSIVIYRYPIFGEPGHRLDLAMRAISGTVCLTTIFMAYRMMPIADASTIHFSSPVFVAVFAFFILKEPFTILQCITGAITIIGVTIISKPEFIFGSTESATVHEYRLEGTLLALTAAISAALSIINLRKLKTTPAAVVVFWFAFAIVISGIVLLSILNKWILPTGWWTWTLLVACGFCGIGDQYFLTKALQYESAGPVSITRTFNIVLSFLWEVVLLAEPIEWTSVAGACLVSSCVVILAVVKWKDENPQLFNKLLFCRCDKLFCCKSTNANFHSLPQSLRSSSDSVYQDTVTSAAVLIDGDNRKL